jgi:hypothetical protein
MFTDISANFENIREDNLSFGFHGQQNAFVPVKPVPKYALPVPTGHLHLKNDAWTRKRSPMKQFVEQYDLYADKSLPLIRSSTITTAIHKCDADDDVQSEDDCIE